VVTSGRRLAAWGNFRGTYIHFVIGARALLLLLLLLLLPALARESWAGLVALGLQQLAQDTGTARCAGLRWYLGASPEELVQLYRTMYTDNYR
jgi:hypothetical protein